MDKCYSACLTYMYKTCWVACLLRTFSLITFAIHWHHPYTWVQIESSTVLQGTQHVSLETINPMHMHSHKICSRR